MAAHSAKEHDTVYFDAQGRHYFQVYPYDPRPIKGSDGKEIKTNFKKGNYGWIKQVILVKPGFEDDPNPDSKIINQYPEASTFIVDSATREEVLNAKPESDLLINLAGLSADEVKAVNSIRTGKAGKTSQEAIA